MSSLGPSSPRLLCVWGPQGPVDVCLWAPGPERPGLARRGSRRSVHLLAAADVERLPRAVGGEVAGEIGAGVAEVLALAAGAGIDPRDAYDALTVSAVSSPFLRYKRDAYLAADDVPVSFTTALMAKDLQLALDIAGETALPLAVTATAKESLDQACAAGFSDADFACVARLLRPRPASG